MKPKPALLNDPLTLRFMQGNYNKNLPIRQLFTLKRNAFGRDTKTYH